MATESGFLEYLAEQLDVGARLSWKKLFGEYSVHLDGRIVAFACDDQLFIKPTDAARHLWEGLPSAPPYPGAKPYPCADELLDVPERLRELLTATAVALPEPRPKMPRKTDRKAKVPAGGKAVTKQAIADKVATRKASVKKTVVKPSQENR